MDQTLHPSSTSSRLTWLISTDLRDRIFHFRCVPSLQHHLPTLLSWLEHLCLNTLLNGSCDETLAIARPLRRLHAEEHIIALSSLHTAPTTSFSQQRPLAASDASMLPSPASLFQARSMTSAAATPNSQVVFSLAGYGTSAGILHGELLGIIAAVLLSIHANLQEPYPVFTDHENAVHMIQKYFPVLYPTFGTISQRIPCIAGYFYTFQHLRPHSSGPPLIPTALRQNVSPMIMLI
ncbi:hypothetical protein BDR06DRAFT_598549 [Suillus hirtellus]|nr:hypothetical protein BDR06DRAFT_598549 [Suillus hirtellus]